MVFERLWAGGVEITNSGVKGDCTLPSRQGSKRLRESIEKDRCVIETGIPQGMRDSAGASSRTQPKMAGTTPTRILPRSARTPYESQIKDSTPPRKNNKIHRKNKEKTIRSGR